MDLDDFDPPYQMVDSNYQILMQILENQCKLVDILQERERGQKGREVALDELMATYNDRQQALIIHFAIAGMALESYINSYAAEEGMASIGKNEYKSLFDLPTILKFRLFPMYFHGKKVDTSKAWHSDLVTIIGIRNDIVHDKPSVIEVDGDEVETLVESHSPVPYKVRMEFSGKVLFSKAQKIISVIEETKPNPFSADPLK